MPAVGGRRFELFGSATREDFPRQVTWISLWSSSPAVPSRAIWACAMTLERCSVEPWIRLVMPTAIRNPQCQAIDRDRQLVYAA
jgi:hypothetical protein